MRKLVFGAMLVVAALALVMVMRGADVNDALFRKSDEEPSAAWVAEEVAREYRAWIASATPDSTLHTITDERAVYDISVERGPGWDPINRRSETWMYFDAAGNAAGFRSETSDLDTRTIENVSVLTDGMVSVDFSPVGTVQRYPLDWTLSELQERIPDPGPAKVLNADLPATVSLVDGRPAWVVEEGTSSGLRRIYVEVASGRVLQTETVTDGEVDRRTELRAREFLPGNQVPPGD